MVSLSLALSRPFSALSSFESNKYSAGWTESEETWAELSSQRYLFESKCQAEWFFYIVNFYIFIFIYLFSFFLSLPVLYTIYDHRLFVQQSHIHLLISEAVLYHPCHVRLLAEKKQSALLILTL